MVRRLVGALARAARGVGAAVRARPGVFLAVTAGVLGLNTFLPPVVLSLARKPWDYFTFNPWLKKLPEYLASGDVSLRRKLEFLPNLALFWFSADSPYGGVEWGFAVLLGDLARFVLMSIMFGTYFALWVHRRDGRLEVGWRARRGRHGGVAGALASTLGLSTGPCTVTGCGAPVIPVLGLAFVGLSSGTLAVLANLSRVATTVVLVAVTLGVAYFGWVVGGDPGEQRPLAPPVRAP
ncbi:MAG: hypothetical protein HY725_22910 [Candidatus Rokubacteria bacterium]|nr:hypothetical protein [Candidatus Rokubacteria bacterium]